LSYCLIKVVSLSSFKLFSVPICIYIKSNLIQSLFNFLKRNFIKTIFCSILLQILYSHKCPYFLREKMRNIFVLLQSFFSFFTSKVPTVSSHIYWFYSVPWLTKIAVLPFSSVFPMTKCTLSTLKGVKLNVRKGRKWR